MRRKQLDYMNIMNYYEDGKLKVWKNSYWNQIKRNIGLINFSEQEKLRVTPITIFGLGALGGSLVEQLVRSGCEKITICDNDIFEESNLNRQICTIHDLGQLKVYVIENYLKKINTNVHIRKYIDINQNNIKNILEGTSIVALTLDNPLTSILISRKCREMKIPMVESWGIPYLWAWWFTHDSLTYENCFELNTQQLSLDQLEESNELKTKINKMMIKKAFNLPGLNKIYDREREVIKEMMAGNLSFRTIAPICRITASYLAFEIIFTGILKLKEMILAPNIIGFDYYGMKPIKFNFLE